MTHRRAALVTLGLLATALAGAVGPRLAHAGWQASTSCTPVGFTPVPLPLEARRFVDIRGADVAAATLGTTGLAAKLLEARFDNTTEFGFFNEAEGGAIVLVQTGKNWRAKLVVSVERRSSDDKKPRLRLRRIFVYDPNNQPREDRADDVVVANGELAIPGADTISSPDGDPDLRWSVTESGEAMLEPLNGARLDVLKPIIAVPTVARFMKSRHHPQNNVAEVIVKLAASPPEKGAVPVVEDLLAPGGARSVNRIWGQAGIVFWLTRVEECTYSIYHFVVDPPWFLSGEHVAWPIEDCQRTFRKVNDAFNTRAALNLYFWFQVGVPVEGLGNQILAFAAPDRSDGPSPGLGAVWMDADCFRPDSKVTCDRVLGHEIGHFLRLRHACAIPAEAAARQCGFGIGPLSCADAPQVQDRIMHGDFVNFPKAEALTAGEITEARQAAGERLR